MTYPRKTASDHGLRVAAGVRIPHLTRPASARRRRNDASGCGILSAAPFRVLAERVRESAFLEE
jgi:hypothetical protein